MSELIVPALSGAISVVTLFSMWLLTEKRKAGFLIGIANQLLWATLIILTDAWGLLVLSWALIFIYARGYVKWGRHD